MLQNIRNKFSTVMAYITIGTIAVAAILLVIALSVLPVVLIMWAYSILF